MVSSLRPASPDQGAISADTPRRCACARTHESAGVLAALRGERKRAGKRENRRERRERKEGRGKRERTGGEDERKGEGEGEKRL